MSDEAREKRLIELREELLQLRAQKSLGGSVQNSGEFKQTRRSIARLLTIMNENKE
ncbi:MAG: 50S ribosomal protein L29 [Candidatus Thalassarchaeaceae archaeon]|jgi:large subunit ribosomal protein L29